MNNIMSERCHDGHSRCRAVRRLLIAAVVAVSLGGCVLGPMPLFDARQTGGDNAMRSSFSDADVQFRNGDKKLACDVSVAAAEMIVSQYRDISRETMDILRSYQKRCGRYVFK